MFGSIQMLFQSFLSILGSKILQGPKIVRVDIVHDAIGGDAASFIKGKSSAFEEINSGKKMIFVGKVSYPKILEDDGSVIAVSITCDCPIVAVIFLQLEETVHEFSIGILRNEVLEFFDW